MMSTLFQISRTEILQIVSAILVGTVLINVGIHVARKVFGRKEYTSIHGYLIPLPTGGEPAASFSEKLPKHTAQSTRGYLHSIPFRSSQEKQAFSNKDAHEALRKLVVSCNEQNPRSTYIGDCSAFSSPQSPKQCACLYARVRKNGISHSLGEIACLRTAGSNTFLQLQLHPEDARFLTQTGWAQPEAKAWSIGLTKNLRNMQSQRILIGPPRSQEELDRIMSPAIEAACSWASRASVDA